MSDRPVFVNTSTDLLKAHGSRLEGLRGKPLQATWVAWDVHGDSWLQDEAVILRIGSDNLEIVCRKFDEIALTWNTVDVSATTLMYPWDATSEQRWCRDSLPVLRQAIGSTVEGLSVVEYRPQITVVKDAHHPENVGKVYRPWLLSGLEFDLGHYRLQIFNAVNQNDITAEPSTGPEFHRVAVW